LAGLGGGWILYRRLAQTAPRMTGLEDFLKDPAAHAAWMLAAGSRCPSAPFQMPVRGYIGFLWDDSFRPFHRHSGLDIFGGTQPGETPVLAAYDGFLTRLPSWKASVIVRIPSDPLQPGRQIWTYYTHMAGPDGSSLIDAAFPPGSSEIPLKAGTELGRMGDFSGTAGDPTGVHVHFSILRDNGKGGFTDERVIENTYDPSPYFGMNLNANLNPTLPVVCR
jgi:hypothetical protein